MKSTKKDINGRSYEMLHFGSIVSLKLASQIADTLKESDLSDTSNIQGMVINLIGNEKFPTLIQELCKNFTCNGLQVDFDNHFSEHQGDLLPCVGMSLKENIVGYFNPQALESLFETALADLA